MQVLSETILDIADVEDCGTPGWCPSVAMCPDVVVGPKWTKARSFSDAILFWVSMLGLFGPSQSWLSFVEHKGIWPSFSLALSMNTLALALAQALAQALVHFT